MAMELSRLASCLKCMELACQVLNGHFEPVYFLQVSKNYDEERCFLKKYGFSIVFLFKAFIFRLVVQEWKKL